MQTSSYNMILQSMLNILKMFYIYKTINKK